MALRGRGVVYAVVALCALVAVPSSAQERTPPPPRPAGTAEFPVVVERRLTDGSTLIVAPMAEAPLVQVDLVLRGGSALDRADRVGTAAFVAGLLTRGTPTRTGDDLAREIDFLGGSLAAGVASDWTAVQLRVLASDLDAGLERMADAVIAPTFPEREVELARDRARSALEAGMEQPVVLAGRAFARTVYGPHPYGRLRTPEAIQAIDRVSLQAFHRVWFHPSAATFVVAGAVTPDRAAAALERAFAKWSRETVPERGRVRPPAPEPTRVVLVHRPQSATASVQLGHLLPSADAPGWTAFRLADAVLGASGGRIARALAEKGLAAGAATLPTVRPDVGAWEATFDAPIDRAADAIGEALAQVERLRTEIVSPAELAAAKALLTGPLGWRVETPEDVAGQLLASRVLGLPTDAPLTFRARVAALDASDVKAVAADWLRTDRLVIVVVGDAVLLAKELERFGPVEVVDPEGRPVDTVTLLAPPTDVRFDASRLRPGTFDYRILLGGQPVGSMKRELALDTVGGASMAFRGSVALAGQTIDQEVVFGLPGFDARAARMAMEVGGQRVAMDARVRDGRLVGTVSSPTGAQRVDRPVPPGTLVADMVEMAVWIADLAVGRELRVPVARLESGGVETQVMRVGGIEDVVVPAGTFSAYRVEIAGSEAQTVWARVEAPHVIVKLAPADRPLTLELVSLPPG